LNCAKYESSGARTWRAVLDGLDAGVRAQGVCFRCRGMHDEALEARQAEVVEDRVLACVEIN